jgi:hypothetical protein
MLRIRLMGPSTHSGNVHLRKYSFPYIHECMLGGQDGFVVEFGEDKG